MKPVLVAFLLCLLPVGALLESVRTDETLRSGDDATLRLEAYIASQFLADGPGGVVLVARGGHTHLRAAYGLVDVEDQRTMTIEQALPIGSVTKSFTAAAILVLAHTGRLTLGDDVRRHVPDAPVGGKVVTIEQLLTHTSGMPNLVDTPDFFEWAKAARSTAELLALTEGVSFHFEPGAAFRYSDSGYILLGAVLEHYVAGDWADAVRELVAQPLDLPSIESAVRWGESAAAAAGYKYEDGRFALAEAVDWSVPHASGSLVATADDLLAWVRAWREGALASPALHERAWAARELPDGTHSGYGFGWQRCDFEGRTAIQHGGWVPGFTASVLHLPEDDLTAVALLNSEGRLVASYLTRRALRLLLTGTPDLVPHALTAGERTALLGTYRTRGGSLWAVTEEEGRLVLDLAGYPVELVALSATQLCAADSDGTWCFSFESGSAARASSVAASLTCEPQARALLVD